MKPIHERSKPWLGTKFPPGWKLATHTVTPGMPINEMWAWQNGKRRVIVTDENHSDGQRWIHGSISVQRGRIRYEDLLYLRRHWLGHDWPAVQFFPTDENYVNIHEHCLHLSACLTADPEWVGANAGDAS